MADWDWGAQFGDDDDDDNEEGGGYQKVMPVEMWWISKGNANRKVICI